jgi:hypothetical protein
MVRLRSSISWVAGLGLAGLVGVGAVRAQETSGANEPVPTLHVYANLMQIPVLVLTPDHERMRPLEESKFRVSLDGGPEFKPTHVRREGEDPISLAVLIDVARSRKELLAGIGEGLAGLAPESLRDRDRVSIYVMDCSLTRTAYDVPADAAKLREAMGRAMQAWRERQGGNHARTCKAELPLWDAMMHVNGELARLDGRRALLVLTDGIDHGSRTSWKQVMLEAQRTSTAVFGLMTREDLEDGRSAGGGWSRAGNSLPGELYPGLTGLERGLPGKENEFNMVCESSGGLEFAASRKNLSRSLVRFTEMLRERYIVEYPRKNEAEAGVHGIVVTVGRDDAFVRPAGISVPLADPKVLADPTTVKATTGAP